MHADLPVNRTPSPVVSIDPSLISLPSTPAGEPTFTPDVEPVFNTWLNGLPEATQSAALPPSPCAINGLDEVRAQSQPSERPPSPYSPIRPYRPRHPYPPAQFRQLQSSINHPYVRPTQSRSLRTLAPTSDPGLSSSVRISRGSSNGRNAPTDTAILPFSTDQERNTNDVALPSHRIATTSMALNVQTGLLQVQQAVSSLQSVLAHSLIPVDEDPLRREIER